MTFSAACPSLTPCCGLGVRLAARSRRAQITSRSARHSSRVATAAASPAAAVSEPTSTASKRIDQVRQSGRCLTILYARRGNAAPRSAASGRPTAGHSEICGRRVSKSGTANDPPQQAPPYHCRALGNGCSPCWATASTASQAMQGSKIALQTRDASYPRTVAGTISRLPFSRSRQQTSWRRSQTAQRGTWRAQPVSAFRAGRLRCPSPRSARQ